MTPTKDAQIPQDWIIYAGSKYQKDEKDDEKVFRFGSMVQANLQRNDFGYVMRNFVLMKPKDFDYIYSILRSCCKDVLITSFNDTLFWKFVGKNLTERILHH